MSDNNLKCRIFNAYFNNLMSNISHLQLDIVDSLLKTYGLLFEVLY